MPDHLLPIREIAENLGLHEDEYDPYGRFIAKVRLTVAERVAQNEQGRLILVTAVTPTGHGEGKTVVSTGLAQAICRHGKRGVLTLREPSLGPVLGFKGGATGGGKSRVVPSHQINLHFTGDMHAITAAHNLLAAAVDAHLHQGNELGFDVNAIAWPRAMDMNDRSLRRMVLGLGGRANGVPRESGFIITAASEIMAVLALSTSRKDMRRRLESIVVGYDGHGEPIRASRLGVTGALMVLLCEALRPNLVQTLEHTPAFVHAGPFANIAHGTSSVMAQRMALGMGDYVVNESGFAADLGAEKYFDIVMPSSGIAPSAVVVVVTVKALQAHGAAVASEDASGPELVEAGLPNLARHLSNLRKFGVPAVVAINHFPADTGDEIAVVESFCVGAGVPSARVEVYARGGEGGLELARLAMEAADGCTERARSLYEPELPLEKKIERLAAEIYGAADVFFEPVARRKLKRFTEMGCGSLPVCVAKTQSSLSDNPKLLGAPTGWTLEVTDASLSAGAGFVVVVAGSMMLMPGLPKESGATRIDLTDDGEITGMDW